MQHPREIGRYIYDHPLGSRSSKTFGDADATFWCCYGTSVEAFARLAGCIYYHSNDSLWVNLPVASELTWTEKGLRVEQQTAFPHEDVTCLVFHCDRPVELTVHVRAHPARHNGYGGTATCGNSRSRWTVRAEGDA